MELTVCAVGGVFGFFFHPGPVENFEQAKQSREESFRTFFSAMLKSGIYLAPSPFECAFPSLAHRPADIAATLDAAAAAMRKVAKAG